MLGLMAEPSNEISVGLNTIFLTSTFRKFEKSYIELLQPPKKPEFRTKFGKVQPELRTNIGQKNPNYTWQFLALFIYRDKVRKDINFLREKREMKIDLLNFFY